MLCFIILTLSILTTFSKAALRCKCLAGDPCFPNEYSWIELSRNLTQPLISRQRPLAAPCYANTSDFDVAACSLARCNRFSLDFLSATSNGLPYTNWEEIVTSNAVANCLYDPHPGDICHQGRVPSYSINVTAVSDIEHATRFASLHNLHLVVKNTGHENLGRPFGLGSVEIFLHNMQNVTFFENFVPAGAPSTIAGTYAITVEAGVQWGSVYSQVALRNRTVVGGIGAGGTVGAGGGWSLGGGHSILSHFYGLGVDNVLQFTVVLPNASHIVTNAYVHSDLFWALALRGGGGPSFGIVTTTTYRTHPNTPYTAAFYTATADSTYSYLELLRTFNRHHNAISDAGWSGFWPFNNNTLFLTLLAQGTPPFNTTSNSTLEKFFEDSRSITGVNVTLSLSVQYPTFDIWYNDNFIDSSKGFGFNYTIGDLSGGIRLAVSSWLIPRSSFDFSGTALADAFLKIPNGRGFMVGGGAVAAASEDSVAAAPAWRNAISDMTLSSSWDETATPSEIQAVRQTVFDLIQPLREIGPPPAGGQYLNEPDFLEEDWQNAYWGDNYPRLLALKKEVDPDDLFIVQKGVNSEQWDDNVVCKHI